jgi:hypothetical protein
MRRRDSFAAMLPCPISKSQPPQPSLVACQSAPLRGESSEPPAQSPAAHWRASIHLDLPGTLLSSPPYHLSWRSFQKPSAAPCPGGPGLAEHYVKRRPSAVLRGDRVIPRLSAGEGSAGPARFGGALLPVVSPSAIWGAALSGPRRSMPRGALLLRRRRLGEGWIGDDPFRPAAAGPHGM